jgi:small subunit ribosomal protein SAe
VLRLRGTISRQSWDVPVDLFFYREPEDLEKIEDSNAAAPEAVVEAVAADWNAEAAPAAASTEVAASW